MTPKIIAVLVLVLSASSTHEADPIPNVIPALEVLERRADRVATIAEAAVRLNDAETAVALAITTKERRAARLTWLYASQDLRAIVRPPRPVMRLARRTP